MNEKLTSADNLRSFEGNKLDNLYEMSGSSGTRGRDSFFNYHGYLDDLWKLRAELADSTWPEIFTRCRNSRKLVLLVVFIALFFDNMLLTTVGKLMFVFVSYLLIRIRARSVVISSKFLLFPNICSSWSIRTRRPK